MQKSEFLQELQRRMPVTMVSVDLRGKRVGVVITDEVDGFCTVGPGHLQPKDFDPRIASMIRATDSAVGLILGRNDSAVVLQVCDRHDADNIERPWPPHCLRGSGEENPVRQLAWLASHPRCTRIYKDCVNAFIGGIRADGFHDIYRWLTGDRIEVLVVVGICTDICVKNFVETMLAVRQHRYPDTGGKMVPTLQEVVVFEPACTTYDAPGHEREIEHHTALHMMQTQGALIANELVTL